MEDVSPEGFLRAGVGRAPVVTRAAFRLHTYAVLASIEAGRPGFVSDEYLDAIHVESSIPALELTLCGLWTRVEQGYRVGHDETLRVACEVQRHLIALDDMGLDR